MVISNAVSRLLVLAVAAAWLASSICTARDNVLLMSPERISEKLTFYPAVPFDTADATKTRYRRFINNVREEIVSGDEVYGIPRLHNPTSLPESDRFLQVALYNSYEQLIILVIDKANVSVLGYRRINTGCFFTDTDASIVFTDTSATVVVSVYELPFSSTYLGMEKLAGSRKNIKLGMLEWNECIKELHDSFDGPTLARCMLVTIQMVSEAVRYRYVENLVVEHIGETSQAFLPTANMITFEDNWKELSTRIQESVGGVIYPPLVLSDASNQDVTITSINPTLGLNIAVILFVCDSCANIPEPTVRIIGGNGLCVDLLDGSYRDGNPVVLWTCSPIKDNYNPQLWTLMKDETIRSKGKCLTAYRLKVGRYVMIYNCTTMPEYSGNKWEIQENGNIINKESKLALNAFTGYSWSVLTIEEKSYSSSQGWSLSNSTKPVVTPILGYNGMCMQASSNNSVQMSSCSDQSVQQWALYPDGTVRPSKSTTNCLTSKSSADGKIVVHDVCDGGSSQRWLFNHDLSVSDANNKYVLEVTNNQEITVVKPSADTPTSEQTFDINSV